MITHLKITSAGTDEAAPPEFHGDRLITRNIPGARLTFLGADASRNPMLLAEGPEVRGGRLLTIADAIATDPWKQNPLAGPMGQYCSAIARSLEAVDGEVSPDQLAQMHRRAFGAAFNVRGGYRNTQIRTLFAPENTGGERRPSLLTGTGWVLLLGEDGNPKVENIGVEGRPHALSVGPEISCLAFPHGEGNGTEALRDLLISPDRNNPRYEDSLFQQSWRYPWHSWPTAIALERKLNS